MNLLRRLISIFNLKPKFMAEKQPTLAEIAEATAKANAKLAALLAAPNDKPKPNPDK